MPNHEDPPQTTDLPQAPDPPRDERTRQASSAPEEFRPDDTSGNTGDTPAGTAAARRRSFASRFPTSDEMGTTSPRSTGPNLWEDSPFDEETIDLYTPDPSAKIEEFKVLECTLPSPGELPEPCPICYPNPYAYVPDYRMMEDGEVFFDGRSCTQNIIYCFEAPAIPAGEMGITAAITTNATAAQAATVGHPGAVAHAGITAYVPTGPTVSELNSKKFQDEHKERAIRLLLDYYNKSDIATVFTYKLLPPKIDPMGLASTIALQGTVGAEGPVGLIVGARKAIAVPPPPVLGYEIIDEPNIDMVAELMQYTEFTYSIPIQLKARTRVLISVPVEQLNRVPPKLVSEPVAEFQTSLKVIFEGREFVTMMRRVSKAFKGYNHSLKQWRTFEGGKLIETKNGNAANLSLDDESSLLESFLNGITEFIEDLGFSFNPLRQAKIPEKLVFKFEEKGEDKIKLRQIVINLPGCPQIKIAKSGRYKGIFNDLAKKSPFNRTRTLSYIGALPEIDIALTARTPTPWMEVVTKYTFPPIAVFYGKNTNTFLNDPTMFACLAKSAIAGGGPAGDESFDEFMDEITGLVLDIPDQILAQFGKLSCYSREDLKEELRDISGDFKDHFIDQKRRVMSEMKRSIATEEPYLNVVMEQLFPAETAWGELTPKQQEAEMKKEGGRKGFIGANKKEEFWRRLSVELGYCGWIGLILAAMDCVAQGLGEESTLKALSKAAFGSMDDAYLGRTFLGLSPESQQKVADSMKRNFGSMPAPWETEKFGGTYQPGSYSGAGFQKDVPGSGTVDSEDYSGPGAFGMDYSEGEFDFNDGKGSQGSGGTLGGALGGVQKEAFDALRNSMLDAVGAGELLEQMEKIPGAPIVTKMLKHLPCKQTPLIFCEPRLDSFFNTVEFDFCNWDKGITWPAFGDGIEGIPNLIKMIMAAAKIVLIETAMAIIMAAIKFLLEKLFSLACELLATLGASLLDVFAGNDHFKNLLKDNMCPGASTEELNDALIGLFSAIGPPDATCLEKLSNSEMGEFIDDLSLMLTQGQILQLLSGNPTEETIRLAIEVAQTSNSECIREIFSDPNAFQTFFPSLGIFVPNLSDLRDKLSPNALDSPISPCPPDTVGKIEDLKCQLLAQKGLSKKECREQIDDLKDKATQDLEDLANLLEDPYAGMPPLLSTDRCNPEGIFAPTNPFLADFNSMATGLMFGNIESMHLRDLWGPINTFTGHGGMLNGIMCDTKGRPYKKHQWLVDVFGTPLAKDLGPFQWYSDDAIRPAKDEGGNDISPGNDNVPVNIFGDRLTQEEGRGNSLLGYTEGGYPPTVGAWMALKYREMTPEFKTINVPGGYPTMEAAEKDLQRIEKLNKKVVRLRLKYIEAFILEFDLEGRGTWAMKFAAAASDLRRGAEGKLFGKDPTKETLKFRAHSPEVRAWNVLNGKNISIAGQLIGGARQPHKWDYRKRSGVDKDAKSFVEFAERMQGTKNAFPINIWDLPDTSSADMRLSFESYPDDPTEEGEEGSYAFSLEYDYNLFDEEAGVLSDKNEYKLKIVETHRTPKGKNLTKKDLKKMGDTLPPVSILQEDEYSYTSHDLTMDSTPSDDVKNVIDTLNIGAPPEFGDSYEIQTFYKFIAKKLIDASSAPKLALEHTELKPFRNYFAKKSRTGPGKGKITLYDEISSGFLKRVSTIIATGDPVAKPMKGRKGEDAGETTSAEADLKELTSLEDISRGFLFGYDPYKEPKIIELDPMVYGGLLARTFPDVFPPPFYVQERKHKGWMDICDMLVPEVSGCEPESKAVYNLGDLADMVGELGETLNPDPRLTQDPLCAQESPYDRIMSPFDAANIDGAIRAIVRIYTLDVFIRGIPVFASFGLSKENYDDLLMAFVTSRMKTGLYADGDPRTGRTDDEYYYRVIEQAFNNTVRKIDSGLLHRLPTSIDGEPAELDPEKEYLTEAEDAALERIRKVVRRFYRENDGELAALSNSAIQSQTMFARMFSTRANAALTGLGAGSSRFGKFEALAAKKTAFEETIRETEDDAEVFLRRYVREEFEKLREDFSIRMPAVVDNIDHLFLLNGQWIRGAVAAGGPTDVTSDPFDPGTYKIEAIEELEEVVYADVQGAEEEGMKVGTAIAVGAAAGSVFGPAGAVAGAVIGGLLHKEDDDDAKVSEGAAADAPSSYWPFVLEKYIRIEEKNKPPIEISDRASNLYNTVNLKDWNKYVKEKKAQGLVGDISDFWGNPPPEGETTEIESHIHTYKIDEDGNGTTGEFTNELGEIHSHEIVDGEIQSAHQSPEDDGHIHDIEITGWKFGLRLSYMPSKKENSVFTTTIGTISDETIMSEKAYKLTDRQGDDRYLIPLAFAESPIPDQNYALYDPKKYDVYCLIQDLVKTPEYRTMFKYIFPLPRFTSFLAIYCAMGFLASIGNVDYPRNGGDMWEMAGGKKMRKFRRWVRGPNTFKKSRQAARSVFNNLYESTQNMDNSMDEKTIGKNFADSLRELIRPRVNFEDGLRWWQRGRRITSNPYNMEGDDCE